MKNLKIKYLLPFFSMVLLVLGVFSSCEDNNASSASGPLLITSVAKSEEGDLVPVTQGYANNIYIINGSGFSTTEKIYFNGVDTYFNPTLVTDTAIFVTIDLNTPYENASNELKIVTKTGTIVYPFVVAPPAPQLKSFQPINPAANDIVTIYGDFFLNPQVSFGTISATIISASLTQIKVKVPAGADKQFLKVTTISGSAVAPQSIGSSAYDDDFYLFDYVGSWGNYPLDIANTLDKSQGLKSIRAEFPGWSGTDLKFKTHKDLTPYKAFRISLKGVKDGSLKLVFNGDNGGWSYQIIMPLTTEWTTVEVPFSDIGNPTFLDKLTFQESGNFGGNTIFIDDMGFVLK
jgi:hypothetical protein